MELMTAGVTTREASVDDASWNVLGQTYVPKHRCDTSMSWHATFPDGTFVPHHIHTTQDEFVYVLTGELEAELDGAAPVKARPGDLVRLPQNVPHGIFNRSGQEATCLFWVSPTGNLWDLFVAIDSLADPVEVVRLSALHQVDFLPPPAQ
ncbi:cupin domain-containing protein [Paracoccus sp. YIM 132242]|uniref:Cupin domain-containing protein n=1 Tax=Paracoccus lichenicola TaxID=2665644 RepID=A0A6L6HQY3_9RHOB|nr:cupin domain-containing protein [Paracoccus lichenicola]MTE01584.1 cupin domain-containing protein [Paracoccus lichenicola]